MSKKNFKKIAIFLSVMFLQPSGSPGSFAWARKKSPPKAYSFIAEGGKASQAECDGERKLPRLKRLKEFSKASSYMGSELQSPELNVKVNEEMWKHFFRQKASCNAVLAQTPSAVENMATKEIKPELPPEDSEDPEESGDKAVDTETE